jgi:hypothetical protein
MDGDPSPDEVLLAVALGSSQGGNERRLLPDRRSGLDRRQVAVEVPTEHRSGAERRQTLRRQEDRNEGATLLQKARSRLASRLGRAEQPR